MIRPASKRDAASALWPYSLDESILIYDGDCGFCVRSLGVLRRMVSLMPVVEASQRADYRKYGLTETDVSSRIYLVAAVSKARADVSETAPVGPTAIPLGGHLAIAAIFAAQPRLLLRLVGRALTLPIVSQLAAGVYALVARNRGRLSQALGSPVACESGSQEKTSA